MKEFSKIPPILWVWYGFLGCVVLVALVIDYLFGIGPKEKQKIPSDLTHV